MPNLSFERLALVLALSACSKATPAAETVQSDMSQEAPSATASAMATTATPPPPPVVGQASASEPKKKQGGMMPAPGGSAGGGHGMGQASCGAGSCTADIKKK